MSPTSPVAARQAAFTLLEIMAVVAIFALVAGIAMPNFSRLQTRNLDSAADRMVGQIEFARQRAIVTGTPHRLSIDIDNGSYRIEALGRGEPDDGSANEPAGLESGFEDFDQPFDLSAPRNAEPEFEPLSGLAGRFTWLGDSISFAGIETTGGWIDQGESFIGFEQDGSADPTTVVIEHRVGHTVTLEILPLASTIRVTHESI